MPLGPRPTEAPDAVSQDGGTADGECARMGAVEAWAEELARRFLLLVIFFEIVRTLGHLGGDVITSN